MRMVVNVAPKVSFDESGALLSELAVAPVDPKQIECRAEALGCEVAADVVYRNGRNRDSPSLC